MLIVCSMRWTKPESRSSWARLPTPFQPGLHVNIPMFLSSLLEGPAEYGRRQNMDITNPNFREAAQRVIVALIDHVKDHPCVIGYQLDNETKSYDTSGPNVQAAFVKWMRSRFPDLAALNKEFGLDYWSNRINRWEDFPSVNGSINASLSSAFAEFQRGLVTDYLAWQAALVRQHARPRSVPDPKLRSRLARATPTAFSRMSTISPQLALSISPASTSTIPRRIT